MQKPILSFFTSHLIIAILLFSAASANADNVYFNYQGRVKVHTEPFNGTGLLKFAILNTSGTAVLWSNDGTVGAGAGPDALPIPGSAVGLPITDGVFSILIGDESIPGMAPLDSTVMVSDTPLRLRVWFSSGDLGFQELKPDYKLMDLTLSKLQTGTEDFTIYVNGENGNDANNGMTVETAKKTISGAVDILPDKIRCNITISIAPGIYREMVTPHGLSVAYGNSLKFSGDTSWTPSAGGAPVVVIDGADSGDTAVRDYCFYASQCTGLVIEGITFQNSKITSMKIENGNYKVSRCLAQHNDIDHGAPSTPEGTGNGFQAGPQCFATFSESKATDNQNRGFGIESSSRAYLTTCTATFNNVGVFATANSIGQFFGYNNFSNNGIGVQANATSDAGAGPSDSDATRTHIQNNYKYGVLVNWGSQFTPYDAVMTGNGKKFYRYYGTIIGVDPQPTSNF